MSPLRGWPLPILQVGRVAGSSCASSSLTGVKRVLGIGVFTGYSALMMPRGLEQ
ncbi:hypothetical protein ACLESO_33710 [Pyxidicoccus sp. 3LG]